MRKPSHLILTLTLALTGRLKAQFDVLGSGTPLINSERGPLTEKTAK